MRENLEKYRAGNEVVHESKEESVKSSESSQTDSEKHEVDIEHKARLDQVKRNLNDELDEVNSSISLDPDLKNSPVSGPIKMQGKLSGRFGPRGSYKKRHLKE